MEIFTGHFLGALLQVMLVNIVRRTPRCSPACLANSMTATGCSWG
jgi:hypothetical protein